MKCILSINVALGSISITNNKTKRTEKNNKNLYLQYCGPCHKRKTAKSRQGFPKELNVLATNLFQSYLWVEMFLL